MPTLYLAQHGKSFSEAEDSERRLTPEGAAETEKVARLLAVAGVKVAEVLHSGKTRARQTAEIFARHLGAPVREADGLAPNDDPRIWASRAEALTSDVLLVGHLPHLSRLASLLLVGDPQKEVIRFRYSGVVKLERGEAGWRLVWYITPEIAP
ncbi:phosphohistidine phosphatase, SixA [Thermoproteus uzoniensis 768-20]|uniref:Phosphohistidine phosphatase, SixA n=1 Tax=Thermoproteus uzoniensis (strain 768-20) TaxID=999630 RepID=F2L1K8_THEU7|nr:phosphohistidine phosphatase SixA [Thermoproteus uzoniensis]AEA11678.1 phosphohistidine phosphatase, SixA [Thermoproteus uzoniensis 768-20]